MEELGLERLMREVADEAGGALDDEAIAERVAAKMQSRGTRCYQMKHNARIVAPHAAQRDAGGRGPAARARARRRRRRRRRRVSLRRNAPSSAALRRRLLSASHAMRRAHGPG